MGKSNIFKVVGAVMTALLTAIGYALDFMQITKFDFKWWPLIFFVIFCLLIVWIISDLYHENKELKNNKPAIKVKPTTEGREYYLEVTNIGAVGNFSAQIEILEDKYLFGGIHTESPYIGYWKLAGSSEAEIKTNQKDLLKIARLHTDINYLPTQRQLILYWYDRKIEEFEWNHLGSYGSYWRTREKPTSENDVMTDQCILSITISAKPDMKEGSFIKNYKLDLWNLDLLGIVEINRP